MHDLPLIQIIDFIGHIDPFNQFKQTELVHIAGCFNTMPLPQGESISLLNRDNEKHLYLIYHGSVEQKKLDGSLRARLEREDIFGFTFLDHTYTAQSPYIVSALEDSQLLTLSHTALNDVLKKCPEYAHYFSAKAQVRLKSATETCWTVNNTHHLVKKVSDVVLPQFVAVNATQTIQSVAQQMQQNAFASAALVFDDVTANHKQLLGIVTTADMANRVIAAGLSAHTAVAHIMTLAPKTIGTNDLLLHAIACMKQHHLGHMPVIKDEQVIGLLTTQHLIQNNRTKCITLLEQIKTASTTQNLKKLSRQREQIFLELIDEKMQPESIGHVMTMLMDATTIRLLELTIDKIGVPPCEFSWIVAGSHARNEIHMLSDQDTALILDDNATKADRFYFKYLAMHVSNGLDACGYPLCSGKFMAATPKWCQPLSAWKHYYKTWVSSPEYDNLLNITVFLETRSIYGNANLTEQLQDDLRQNIRGNKEFLGVLALEATKITPPLGIFNNLVLEKNGDNMKTLNIKKYAISLIIDLARIYGLAAECHASGTEERFKSARDKQILSNDAFMDIIGAYQFIMQFRFSHQSQLMQSGEQPNNHINPDLFGNFERKHLKDAFRIISDLQDATKIKFKLL